MFARARARASPTISRNIAVKKRAPARSGVGICSMLLNLSSSIFHQYASARARAPVPVYTYTRAFGHLRDTLINSRLHQRLSGTSMQREPSTDEHTEFVASRLRLDKSDCTRRLKPKGTRGPCRKVSEPRSGDLPACRFHG